MITPTPIAADYRDAVEQLVAELASNAVERDHRGGTAWHERNLLRASGLLTLSIPRAYGGPELPWVEIFRIVRRIAEVDSAMAHLLAFQHLQLVGIQLYASEAQKQRYLRGTLEHNWFWGNAVNPVDPRSHASRDGKRLVVNGCKGFCSGSVDADYLLISARFDESGEALIAAVPAGRDGLRVHGDWNSFGQRQTDSGTVSFGQLAVDWDEVLNDPGPAGSVRTTLRPNVAQLILTNLYLGIAGGALQTARDYTVNQSRPWFTSGVESSTADPYILHRYAEMWLKLKPASMLADEAAVRLDQTLAAGDALTAAQRAGVAVAITEAKILATRAGLDITAQLFDVAGARATSGVLALDRFWRNVRTHTLHDPVDYKLKELGNWVLNDIAPTPSLYS